jgi:hypothetical protein
VAAEEVLDDVCAQALEQMPTTESLDGEGQVGSLLRSTDKNARWLN